MTGGRGGGGGGGTLSSTELLLPSATSWSYSAALPSTRYSLRGATLDNKVLVTGTNRDTLILMRHELFHKYYNSLHNAGGKYRDGSFWDNYTYYEDVLEYDEQKREWNKIGSMSIKRSFHAVTVVTYNSIEDYCN